MRQGRRSAPKTTPELKRLAQEGRELLKEADDVEPPYDGVPADLATSGIHQSKSDKTQGESDSQLSNDVLDVQGLFVDVFTRANQIARHTLRLTGSCWRMCKACLPTWRLQPSTTANQTRCKVRLVIVHALDGCVRHSD